MAEPDTTFDWDSVHLEALGLGTRAYNLLRSLNLTTVGQIKDYVSSGFPVGKKGTWKEITDAVSESGRARIALWQAEDRAKPHCVVITVWTLGRDEIFATKDEAQAALAKT